MRVLLLCFFLAACAEPAAPPVPISPCVEQRFEQAGFIVCRAGRVEIRSGMRSFKTLQARLGPRADEVAFAVNAGMFDDVGAPIGLLVEDGREVRAINRRTGGGNFHLMPNGVYQVRRDGRAEVVTSAQWRPAPDIRLATQSGPMLVIDGKLHPAFDHEGSSRHIRNGVGIAPDGRARFVISDGPVSLGKFARFFRDRLKCRDALFFDGAVSALWDPANHRRDVTVPLGPMVVAFKPAESKPGRASPARP